MRDLFMTKLAKSRYIGIISWRVMQKGLMYTPPASVVHILGEISGEMGSSLVPEGGPVCVMMSPQFECFSE